MLANGGGTTTIVEDGGGDDRTRGQHCQMKLAMYGEVSVLAMENLSRQQ